MTNKKQIDDLISKDKFPTPKKIIWFLKQDGISVSKEEEQYIWTNCQFILEQMAANAVHPAQTSVYTKYLERNFPDWDANKKVVEEDEKVIINISLSNDSENTI